MLTDDERLFLDANKIPVMPNKKAEAFINLLSNTGLVCKFCKKNNVLYRPVQTRSMDEGMTIFHACMDCGKKWSN